MFGYDLLRSLCFNYALIMNYVKSVQFKRLSAKVMGEGTPV